LIYEIRARLRFKPRGGLESHQALSWSFAIQADDLDSEALPTCKKVALFSSLENHASDQAIADHASKKMLQHYSHVRMDARCIAHAGLEAGSEE